MSTRTYYRGPDAVVTDELFVWRGTRFVIRNLRNVGRGRGDVDRLRPYQAYSATGALIVIAAAWATLDAPAAYALAGVAITIPVVLTVAARRIQPPRWELRATYHNQSVIIYASSDERVFNQVTRALRRSMEDARSPARDHGLAAA